MSAIKLEFAGRTYEVSEQTMELAEMAYADYGLPKARGVLRELCPELTLGPACAALLEAERRASDKCTSTPNGGTTPCLGRIS